MLVRDIMTRSPRHIRPDATVAEAARIMWDIDCGIVPVLGTSGRLVGVLTDRDICIAAATRDVAPGQLLVSALTHKAGQPVITCRPDEDVRSALARMAEHHVRRLPVTDDGHMVGLLSIDDVAGAASDAPDADVHYADVARTLQAICERTRRHAPV
jgi:CBS domain-containing protein